MAAVFFHSAMNCFFPALLSDHWGTGLLLSLLWCAAGSRERREETQVETATCVIINAINADKHCFLQYNIRLLNWDY